MPKAEQQFKRNQSVKFNRTGGHGDTQIGTGKVLGTRPTARGNFIEVKCDHDKVTRAFRPAHLTAA